MSKSFNLIELKWIKLIMRKCIKIYLNNMLFLHYINLAENVSHCKKSWYKKT